jgi:hypothetical protein
VTLQSAGRPAERLERGDAFCVPAGTVYSLGECSDAFEMLEVSVPA